MNELVASLEMHGGSIKRSLTNFKKLGAANINSKAIRRRVDLVKEYWEETRRLHAKLMGMTTEDQRKEISYFKQNKFLEIEESYDSAVAEYHALLDELEGDLNNESTASNSHDRRTSSAMQQPALRLPRLDLPKFAGSYVKWTSSKEQFCSIFDSYPETSKVQKLQYLKSCLVGEALSLIDNMLVTEANYDSAWKILKERYENKRLIVEAYLESFINLPKINTRSVKDLRTLLDQSSSAIIALTNLKVCSLAWDPIIVFIVTSKLDLQTRTEWEFELKDVTDTPTFTRLKSFLAATIRALESSTTKKTLYSSSSTKPVKSTNQTFRSYQTNVSINRCVLCRSNHRLHQCEKFKEKSVPNRLHFVKQHQICVNCLGQGHFISKCKSLNLCSICKQKHHSLLHKFSQTNASSSAQDPVSERDASAGASRISQTSPDVNTLPSVCNSSATKTSTDYILLPTAITLIKSSNGRFTTGRALLDQGSQASFISERMAKVLKVDTERIEARVSVVGGSKSGEIKLAASFAIEPTHGLGPSLDVKAFVLPKLTSYMPAMMTVRSSWQHLHEIQLADPAPQRIGPVDLILGSDLLGHIFLGEIKRGAQDAPVALNTIFGWVVFGRYSSISSDISSSLVVNQACICDELRQSFSQFWELEKIPEASPISEEELQCENHFSETHSRDEFGRYVVCLPFKSGSHVELPNSALIAKKMLIQNESRLQNQPERLQAYQDFMAEYISLGHMREAPDSTFPSLSDKTVNYIPHHSVWRETSTTSKLRVVFNASMQCSNKKSLNDFLCVGPKLQADLASLISRWRSFRFVLSADIEEMFRQILLNERDLDLQRIYWRADPNDPLKSYQLLTVTYGTACAPYLANRVIKQLATDEAPTFPAASAVLMNQVYVDDVMFGADDLDTAFTLRTEVLNLLKAGGFHLRKWASNSSALLTDIDGTNHGLACDKLLQEDENLKILGISWNPRTDSFRIQISLPEISSFSKRSFLSFMLKNFDPLGWVIAVTIQAKIILQTIWTRQIDWDEPLPNELNSHCLNYYNQLPHLRNVSIPRWTGQLSNSLQTSIHGFSDASSSAYGAVVYLSVINAQGENRISLISAKAKAAPLKVVSIPRLELCAAQLLAKLVRLVQESMNLLDNPVWCWTDSSVALTWIRSPPTKWKTFVANRVSDILTKAPQAIWRFVPGKENPADFASRGLNAARIASCELWWQGPQWLKHPIENWPANIVEQAKEAFNEQKRENIVLTISSVDLWSPFTPVSKWTRLLRVTCFCRRFLARYVLKRNNPAELALSSSEIIEAETCWLRKLQGLFYKEGLKRLGKGQPLSNHSRLLKLNPSLDKNGLLRVGGRLSNSSLLPSEKFPVVLPKCEVTEIIIRKVHLKTLHGGVQLMLYTLRKKYWIVGARVSVKRCIAKCVKCVRERAVPAFQLMGTLPRARVSPSRPFSHTGIDYAGPFLVRHSKGRGQRFDKNYICLCICFATRAIHLELVDSYSTSDFLAAFTRFTARRGLPSDVYTDNGTNFIGADRELSSSFKSVMQDPLLKDYVAHDQVNWHYIPPGAPHFGGLWEAGVKSVKHHLRRIIGKHIPLRDEFVTILCKIEACLNSRPIAPLHDDVESLEALTPGHFLVGSSLTSAPTPSVLNIRENRLSRWQMVQKIVEDFWKIWARDYLNSLQQRSRWHIRQHNIKVNDLVLLSNPNLPPAKWDLARVTECYPGPDDLVRAVTVKTVTGTYKRPISKLCLLPVNLEN